MSYNVVEIDNVKYVEMVPGKFIIANERDAVDIVGICGEYDANRLMFYAENLTDSFFDLKSCQAGFILQKFMNYGIKVAAVFPSDNVRPGRFREMVIEANRGSHFRVFEARDEAENWLTGRRSGNGG